MTYSQAAPANPPLGLTQRRIWPRFSSAPLKLYKIVIAMLLTTFGLNVGFKFTVEKVGLNSPAVEGYSMLG